MRYEILSFHRENRVMVIQLHGNGTCYGEPVQIANELNELCNTIYPDPEIQVVIINLEQTGWQNKLTLSQTILNTDPARDNPMSWAEPVSKLEIPVIMSINGYALGQALELALACDMRVASHASFFGLPHINDDIIPWDGGTQRLSRLIGKSNAMEMLFTGQTINGEEALRMGLVNQLIEGKALLSKVMETAQKIAGKGPIALKYTKEAVNKGMDLTMDQALNLEADLYFLLHTSHDRTEGIKAFQEKRKARFSGE
ncbi:MAG: enoyl-CoA hydratase/isomerase family protein [Deltaproteobacteria bacterium]|uniref:enoyl-CoA hydratase/isomerase family protein n=1 Tax=Desulfobacula sp. TaxID=2593537 RepID=UPI0019C2E16C|nr:enoyl-CoA hydratase/isomerase family protein [Candidatus Desulfobacula maris]MBL6993756.1 enoyl-CoA hydratase/isomerase family protein [Desulfobacula sp.]